MNEKIKWNLLKSILINVSVRNSILHGGLCEEENYIHIRYGGEKEAKAERRKALANLTKVEKELEENIQKFREANNRVSDWKSYEIIWLVTFFGNIFCMDFRSFRDSQDFRSLLGNNMEDYLPLLTSIQSEDGKLSKFFKSEFNRYYYSFELKDEKPEELIDFILK